MCWLSDNILRSMALDMPAYRQGCQAVIAAGSLDSLRGLVLPSGIGSRGTQVPGHPCFREPWQLNAAGLDSRGC